MIFALVRLMRLYYSLPLSCGLVVITAYVVGGDFSIVGITLIPAVVALFLVISAGYIFNDVCDRTVDAVNRPNNALATQKITPRAAFIAAVLLFAAGLGAALYGGWKFFGVLATVTAGLVLYDLYSKRMGIFKNIMAAALTVSLYPLSFALAEPVPTPRLHALAIFPVWLFLTAVGYEMLKDIGDVKGDRIRWGNRAFCEHPAFLPAAKGIIMTAALLTILPYLLGYCKSIYLACSIISILLGVVSLKLDPVKAIRLVYIEVFLITAGSLADLWVFGA